MDKNELLNDFLNFKVGRKALDEAFGEDLTGSDGASVEITPKNVTDALMAYSFGTVTRDDFLSWVDVLNTTTLYYIDEKNEKSISSIISALHSMNTEGVELNQAHIFQMIQCIMNNTEYGHHHHDGDDDDDDE
jgi:hypothetical protein